MALPHLERGQRGPQANRRPRKLLLFVGDFLGGGTQHYLLRLLRHLDRDRFEPTVACFVPEGPLHEPAARLAPIVAFPLGGHLFGARGLSALVRFARLVRSERFDVVHTLSDRANVFGLLGCAIASPPRVVASQRALDPVYDGFTYARPSLVRLSRFLFRHVPHCVTVNNTVIASHLERVVGVPRERIRLVPNGVDTERFAPRPRDTALAGSLGIAADRQTLGIVARLAPRKGHLQLLEALSTFAPAERPLLIAAGDGPSRDEIVVEVQRRGLEPWVRLVGFLADPARLYNLLDVFCLPTTFAEGTPTALVEALSSGVPCVVSDLPQIQSVIVHEETALVVTPARPLEVAAAIRRVGADAELRRRLREGGRDVALKRYSLEVMIRESEAAYGEVSSPA